MLKRSLRLVVIILLLVAQAIASGVQAQSHQTGAAENRTVGWFGSASGRVYRFYSPYVYPYRHPFPRYHYPIGEHPLLRVAPYVCLDHERSFTNQAGFVDHVGATHKIPLQAVLSFCAQDGSRCVYYGHPLR